jgi:hypothetical protein
VASYSVLLVTLVEGRRPTAESLGDVSTTVAIDGIGATADVAAPRHTVAITVASSPRAAACRGASVR